MPNPFRDPSLWVRTLAFSAALAGISAGLCGLNYAGFSLLGSATGSSASPMNHAATGLGTVLTVTGLFELGGIVIGAAGIVLSAVAILIRICWRLANRKG